MESIYQGTMQELMENLDGDFNSLPQELQNTYVIVRRNKEGTDANRNRVVGDLGVQDLLEYKKKPNKT